MAAGEPVRDEQFKKLQAELAEMQSQEQQSKLTCLMVQELGQQHGPLIKLTRQEKRWLKDTSMYLNKDATGLN